MQAAFSSHGCNICIHMHATQLQWLLNVQQHNSGAQHANYRMLHSPGCFPPWEPSFAYLGSLLLPTLGALFCLPLKPSFANFWSQLLPILGASIVYLGSLFLPTLRAFFCPPWEPSFASCPHWEPSFRVRFQWTPHRGPTIGRSFGSVGCTHRHLYLACLSRQYFFRKLQAAPATNLLAIHCTIYLYIIAISLYTEHMCSRTTTLHHNRCSTHCSF